MIPFKRNLFIAGAVLLLTGGIATSLSTSADAKGDNKDGANLVRHLSGHVHAPEKNRRVKVPTSVDGCDRHYGAVHQCVPENLPTGAAGCAYLTKHHFKNLKVVGKDTKGIDVDGDRIACNH